MAVLSVNGLSFGHERLSSQQILGFRFRVWATGFFSGMGVSMSRSGADKKTSNAQLSSRRHGDSGLGNFLPISKGPLISLILTVRPYKKDQRILRIDP